MRVIPDAVVVIEDGVFTFGNDAAVALSGIGAEEEFVGMPVTLFQTPDVIAETTAFADLLIEAFRGLELWSTE